MEAIHTNMTDYEWIHGRSWAKHFSTLLLSGGESDSHELPFEHVTFLKKTMAQEYSDIDQDIRVLDPTLDNASWAKDAFVDGKLSTEIESIVKKRYADQFNNGFQLGSKYFEWFANLKDIQLRISFADTDTDCNNFFNFDSLT